MWLFMRYTLVRVPVNMWMWWSCFRFWLVLIIWHILLLVICFGIMIDTLLIVGC